MESRSRASFVRQMHRNSILKGARTSLPTPLKPFSEVHANTRGQMSRPIKRPSLSEGANLARSFEKWTCGDVQVCVSLLPIFKRPQ